MPHDHPGFTYWQAGDLNHPFPIGDLSLQFGDEANMQVMADFDLPKALPHKKTVAERSMGLVNSAQLWLALECTENAAGVITCELVARGRHLHWFPAHNETDSGPLQEIRLTDAALRAGGGDREQLVLHGPHCDLFTVSCYLNFPAGLRCRVTVMHFKSSVQAFLDAREQSRREAELNPRPIEPPHFTPMPSPVPPPLPEDEPDLGDLT